MVYLKALAATLMTLVGFGLSTVVIYLLPSWALFVAAGLCLIALYFMFVELLAD